MRISEKRRQALYNVIREEVMLVRIKMARRCTEQAENLNDRDVATLPESIYKAALTALGCEIKEES